MTILYKDLNITTDAYIAIATFTLILIVGLYCIISQKATKLDIVKLIEQAGDNEDAITIVFSCINNDRLRKIDCKNASEQIAKTLILDSADRKIEGFKAENHHRFSNL